MHWDYASEMGFLCPLEQSRRPGRPRFQIPEELSRGLHDIHAVWKEVAKEADGSYETVLRRRHQYSLVENETTGPRITYSDISNGQLCQVVNEVLQITPNAGETYVTGVVFFADCDMKDLITYKWSSNQRSKYSRTLIFSVGRFWRESLKRESPMDWPSAFSLGLAFDSLYAFAM